jgi:hypothetical protein
LNTVDTAYGEGSRLARRPGRRALAIALTVIAFLVAGLFAVKALTGEEERGAGKLRGPSADSFTLSYPEGWRPLSKEELSTLAGHPLAVVRRKDGKGLVVLRREKRAPASFSEFSRELTRELDKRVPDFQRQSSRTVRIRAGTAFFYSYIRKRKGTVHSVVVVPAGDRSYAFNTVSRGGEPDVARQIARILISFSV